ncbi:zinc ribbon domain-containing protein [Methanobrevibacter sp.]|uniref:zinc ribbon domain-containing protein n=1 Tax=Methanobrevibacter sp. TaxID=66852 RepID=UPI0025DAC52B|nr:zinc ribbon domain-containing protein [Methanobrevibacter sp.]MBQ2831198.1 zinc ribbon domain-containing protein [Methanobrevibacter sp.]
MKCPKCQVDNSDSAKFCKKCGAPLAKKVINHETMINSMNEADSSNNNTTKIIIIALAVIAIVLAGAFVYLWLNGDSGDDSDVNVVDADTDDVTPDDSSPSTASPSQPSASSMQILGGSFQTGSSLSDRTYASIYVGSQYSGQDVKIQIWYYNDGDTLNNGNMVPKTVDSSGYIHVRSANAFAYYPDTAVINLYDTSGNLLDTQTVYLSANSGTQTF